MLLYISITVLGGFFVLLAGQLTYEIIEEFSVTNFSI